MRRTKILSVSLPEETYKVVSNLAKTEGKTKSEFIRSVVNLKRKSDWREGWKSLRKLGEDTGIKFNIKNEDDIDRLIHEFRGET
ncbi:MAG: ribbon-helix-helix protein, CopG family [Candidatus Woykebacteria bacterium]